MSQGVDVSSRRPAFAVVDDEVLAALAAIVGRAHVLHTPGDLEPFTRDATPLHRGHPEAVVLPATTAEVSAVLRLATERCIAVTPRGAGSNLAAATVAEHGGIVLVLTRMNQIIEVNPAELLLIAQAGVTNAAVGQAADRVGLLYPPDPGSRTVATIGGNVATCAGGLRGLKYGVTRHWVLGVEAVLPTGEIVRTGGRLVKDVAGYDLTRLLTGSEGTLAVITEVTVGLVRRPALSATGVAFFDTLAQAGHTVADIIATGTLPATLEFLDNRCIRAVEAYAHLGLDVDAGALLIFGDDGEPAAVEVALRRMADTAVAHGARGINLALDVAGSEALLAARRCSLPALARLAPITMLEDVSVPRTKLAEMVETIDAIAERHQVTCATFGHAGDGNLHPTIVFDPRHEGIQVRAEAAIDEIFKAAMALGGTITGEHGVGAAKRQWLPQRLGPEQMALARRIKSAFDPAGILNPGKLGS